MNIFIYNIKTYAFEVIHFWIIYIFYMETYDNEVMDVEY